MKADWNDISCVNNASEIFPNRSGKGNLVLSIINIVYQLLIVPQETIPFSKNNQFPARKTRFK